MKFSSLLLACLLSASAACGAAEPREAPSLWQEAISVHADGGRFVDFASDALSTAAESQSRALFLALVAGDRALFEKTYGWLRDNLAPSGSVVPMARLWGRKQDGSWGITDDRSDVGAELWAVYALLEAGRLWKQPAYEEAAREGMKNLKARFTEVRGVGTLIAAEPAKDGRVLFRPADFPPFILKRLAAADPDFKPAADGAVRAAMLISPDGIMPDAARFDAAGKNRPEKTALSSGGTPAAYLWFAMTATTDPVYPLARERFRNATELVASRFAAPASVDIAALRYSEAVSPALAACFLPYLPDSRSTAYLRTAVEQEPLDKKKLTETLLRLIGLGFDRRLFRFDRDGRLLLKEVP
jgi:endoglucanase